VASCGVTVEPVDPANPRECSCGEPADFLVFTLWYRGRRSQDAVCEYHLQPVVGGIKRELAKRNGG
jgi:hypothetical protein